MLPRARLSHRRNVEDMTTLIDEARARRELPSPALARAIREAAGASQGGIARELDVTRMTICRWEAGAFKPSGQRLIAYAALLRELQNITGGTR